MTTSSVTDRDSKLLAHGRNREIGRMFSLQTPEKYFVELLEG